MSLDESEDNQRRRVIEVIIGPCSTEDAEQAAIHVQEFLDDRHKDLGAAVAIDLQLDLGVLS